MPLTYLKKQTRGSILIMVVIVIPILLGIVSLAVDLGNVFMVRSQMQNAADAASLAAAGRLRSGTTAAQIAIAKTAAVNIANLNGFPVGATTTIAVAIPPGPSPDGSTATYAANPLYARVTITHGVSLFFGGIVGISNVLQTKQAVAGLSPAPPCMIALKTSSVGLQVGGNASISAPNCALDVNSAAKPAVKIFGSATVQAQSINIASSGTLQGNTLSPTVVNYNTAPAPDLFSKTVMPAVSGCTEPANGQVSLTPGCYQGNRGTKQMTWSGTMTLAPGTYVFKNGLKMTGNGILSGSGVTIYNAGGADAGAIDIGGGIIAQLSAPTSGTYQGMLFIQDPLNTQPAILIGNTNSYFKGNLYFPASDLTLNGTSSTTISMGTVVASGVNLSGTSDFSMSNQYSTGLGTTQTQSLYE